MSGCEAVIEEIQRAFGGNAYPGKRFLQGSFEVVEHLTTHPYLTAGGVLFGIALSSGVIMLLIVRVAKRLAARLTGRGRMPVSGGQEEELGP